MNNEELIKLLTKKGVLVTQFHEIQEETIIDQPTTEEQVSEIKTIQTEIINLLGDLI